MSSYGTYNRTFGYTASRPPSATTKPGITTVTAKPGITTVTAQQKITFNN